MEHRLGSRPCREVLPEIQGTAKIWDSKRFDKLWGSGWKASKVQSQLWWDQKWPTSFLRSGKWGLSTGGWGEHFSAALQNWTEKFYSGKCEGFKNSRIGVPLQRGDYNLTFLGMHRKLVGILFWSSLDRPKHLTKLETSPHQPAIEWLCGRRGGEHSPPLCCGQIRCKRTPLRPLFFLPAQMAMLLNLRTSDWACGFPFKSL